MAPRDRRETIAAELKADTAGFSRGLNVASRQVRGFTRKGTREAGRFRQAWSRLGIGELRNKFRGLAGTLGSLAGVYGFQRVIRKTMEFEDTLADLAIRGNKSIDWTSKARNQILEMSRATGVGKESLAKYAIKYTELTGNASAAMSTMQEMAKVSVATGADIGNLATIVDQLSGSLGITKAKAYDAFNVLRQQEKLGAVGFKDIASLLPQLSSTAGTTFGAKGIRGIQNVGALLQIARRGTGSSAEAGVATARFMENIAQKRGKVEKIIGKKLTGEGGQWKDLEEIAKIIGEAMNNLGLDQKAKLTRALGVRGSKAARAYGMAYKTGWGSASGDRAAASSIFGAGGQDVVGEDYQKRMMTKGQRYKKAMAEVDAAAHEAFLPVLEKLVDIMPTLASGAKWLLEHMELLGKLWIAWKASGVLNSVIGATQALAGGGGRGGARGGGMGVSSGGYGGNTRAMAVNTGMGIASTAIGIVGAYVSYAMNEAHKKRMAEIHKKIEAQEKENKKEKGQIKKEIKGKDLKIMEIWYRHFATGESQGAAEAAGERKKLLPGLGEQYGKTGGYTYNVQKELDKEGGLEGMKKKLMRLKGLREKIVGVGVTEAGEKGVKLTRGEVAQTSKSVQAIDQIVKRYERSIAELISGKKTQIIVKVPLNLITPSDRVTNRTTMEKSGGSAGAGVNTMGGVVSDKQARGSAGDVT